MKDKTKLEKLLDWLIPRHMESRPYLDDKRFVYNLIIIGTEMTTCRVFSTSAPLNIGEHVVLAPNQSFRVMHIAHVIYRPMDDPTLLRPTTLLHAGVAPLPGTATDLDSLTKMGFAVSAKKPLYTIH